MPETITEKRKKKTKQNTFHLHNIRQRKEGQQHTTMRQTRLGGFGWPIKAFGALAAIACVLILFNELDLLEMATTTLSNTKDKAPERPKGNVAGTNRDTLTSSPAKNANKALLPSKYVSKDLFESSDGRIFESKEYQLELNSSQWENRDLGVKMYLERINQFLGLNLTRENGQESVRVEAHYGTGECGRGRPVRVRDYVWGHLANETTVDMKMISTNGKEGVLKRIESFDPTIPSPKYSRGAIQKLEQDMHPCKDFKWSRETRITNVPFRFFPANCASVAEIWPDAFRPKYDPNVHATMRVYKEKLVKIWWTLTHSGRLPSGNKFKSAFTLNYNTENSAIYGTTKPGLNSEWSLRVWADEDGFGSWDQNTLDRIWKAYVNLLDTFGSGHEWPCPQDLVAAKNENAV